jgi:hypothetical protein
MLAKSEMKERLLSVLEESRLDNVFSLLNSVLTPTGQLFETAILRDAIVELVRERAVSIGTENYYPREEKIFDDPAAAAAASAIDSQFRFDASRQVWTLARGELRTARIPFLKLTDGGLLLARKILTARGYRWWATKEYRSPA